VRDGTANPVFKALREPGLDRGRAICVERVDAAGLSTQRAIWRRRSPWP